MIARPKRDVAGPNREDSLQTLATPRPPLPEIHRPCLSKTAAAPPRDPLIIYGFAAPLLVARLVPRPGRGVDHRSSGAPPGVTRDPDLLQISLFPSPIP
eukprot:scaffold13642_cov148-Isochrysis_galbana.AAC.2